MHIDSTLQYSLPVSTCCLALFPNTHAFLFGRGLWNKGTSGNENSICLLGGQIAMWQ